MSLLKVQPVLFAHIFVVYCNMLELVTLFRTGRQSNMVFLKDQYCMGPRLFNLLINDLPYFINYA